jgi:surface protein
MAHKRRFFVALISSIAFVLGSITAGIPAQAVGPGVCDPTNLNQFVLKFTTQAEPVPVVLPLQDFVGTVDWGDGDPDGFDPSTNPVAGSTLPANATSTVCITGSATGFGGHQPGVAGWPGAEVLTSVDQWGNLGSGLTSLEEAFWGASILTDVPADLPPTVTNTADMFWGAPLINDPDISSWNTSAVTNMFRMFGYATSFNQDISTKTVGSSQQYQAWDTSDVTDMSSMFSGATAFGQGASWNIGNWNTSSVTDMSEMFHGAENFDQDLHRWDTSKVEFMGGMFEDATLFGSSAPSSVRNWDTSSVYDMNSMFAGAENFNEDIGNWDTSSVGLSQYWWSGPGDMADMFNGASAFNQDISTKTVGSPPSYTAWDTSSVPDMSGMFADATAFDQDISNWNTELVMDMSGMFANATAFNQDISGWDVSRVEDISGMFAGASLFNHDLETWNTSSVSWMEATFSMATSFDGNISTWDTGNVQNMAFMFAGASDFNQDLSQWDTSQVEDMSLMFTDATLFNQDLSQWDTSLVTNMQSMFDGAESFGANINGAPVSWSIGAWDTSSVTDMTSMFIEAVEFNQDISGWNTGNVTDMSSMFEDAHVFNQDIGSWNISSLESAEYMFSHAGLTPLTYSKILRGWAAGSYPSGTLSQPIRFEALTGISGTDYYSTVSASRQTLIDHYWIIDDGDELASTTPVILGNPSASSLTVGQDLSQSVLTGGLASVAGTFTFANPSLIPGLGNVAQSVAFTPANDIEYNSVMTSVSVDVIAAPTPTPKIEASALGYTGNKLDGQISLSWLLIAAGLVALTASRAIHRKR